MPEITGSLYYLKKLEQCISTIPKTDVCQFHYAELRCVYVCTGSVRSVCIRAPRRSTLSSFLLEPPRSKIRATLTTPPKPRGHVTTGFFISKYELNLHNDRALVHIFIFNKKTTWDSRHSSTYVTSRLNCAVCTGRKAVRKEEI